MLPFDDVVLPHPVSISYETDTYTIYIMGVLVATHQYKVHIYSDFKNIETSITEFLTKNPQFLQLKNNDDNQVKSKTYDGRIDIINNSELVTNHVIKWINHWNISIEQLAELHQIMIKFNPSNTAGYMDNHFKISNIGHANATGVVTYISNYNGLSSYNTTGTGSYTTVSPILHPLRVYINRNISIKLTAPNFREIAYLDNCNIELITVEFSVSELSNYLILMPIMHRTQGVYLFKDLLKFSDAKFKFFYNLYGKYVESNKLFIDPYNIIIGSNGNSYPRNLCDFNKDQLIYQAYNEFIRVVDTIFKLIPKHIDKFPFDTLYRIPNISTLPQTDFQWAYTNHIAGKLYDPYKILMSVIESPSESVKFSAEYTKMLLPYIKVNDSVLDDYLSYTHATLFDKCTDPTQEPLDSRHSYYIRYIESITSLIEDGQRIYNLYPNSFMIEGVGEIKMSPIKGSISRKLQNSIYNHRAETKISLETKLALFVNADGSNDLMQLPTEYTLSNELDQYRIKNKSHMIFLGKDLKHCLGTYAESSDLFFRKNKVCAKVNKKTFNIDMCYDYHNTTTDDSKAFNLELQNLLWKQKKSMVLHTICTPETNAEYWEMDEHKDALIALVNTKFTEFMNVLYPSVLTMNSSIIIGGSNNRIYNAGVDYANLIGEPNTDDIRDRINVPVNVNRNGRIYRGTQEQVDRIDDIIDEQEPETEDVNA